MKRTFGVAAVVMMSVLMAGAQTSTIVKDDLFAGTEIFAKGATDVNEITMDPGTLGMVDGKDKAKARRTVLSVVRTYSYDKPGMYRIEDVEVFRNKLNTGDWHCSVHTRSLKTGESTDVCNKTRTDDLKETAIITVEPKQLTFIHTIGHSSSASWSGGSYGSGMSYMGGMDPAWRAEMAISMAEMQAQMAEMRANPGAMGFTGGGDMAALQLNLDGAMRGHINGEAQRQIDQAMKNLPKQNRKLNSGQMQKTMDAAIKALENAEKNDAQPKQPE